MIELQSTLSQRAMAQQLTMGMMGSLNEGTKTVAGNVGRDGGARPVCKLCAAKAKQP